MENDVVVSSVEIIKDRLYFATLQGDYLPKSTKNSKYFQLNEKIVYESFFSDYGPYHLYHLFSFCVTLNHRLEKLPKSKKLVFYTSDDKIQRLNAAYLIGSYMIIYLNKPPYETYHFVTTGNFKLRSFRDASSGYPLFEIGLHDVLEGLHKAYTRGFFDFEHFNYKEYLFYEKVLNGDLNWIIPGKMLAFTGPHSQSRFVDDYPVHAPDHYHRYFKENNVTAVVRLNQKSYHPNRFTEFGFEHHELFFPDGSVPTYTIVDKFNKLSENTKGAVAVHCKAGLGRTGTLIACYMMKHYKFKAKQAIGWLRICRPGSVIGYQQEFLIEIQTRMWSEGDKYRHTHGIIEIPKFKHGIYYDRKCFRNDELENDNFNESDVNISNLDDLENVPTIKPAGCKIDKLDADISPTKQSKEDFVNLDSIINSNQMDTIGTRSMTKMRASTALENAKNSYTANKNNYMMSNNVKSATVTKMQIGLTTKKLASSTSTSIVSSSARATAYASTKGSVNNPAKVAQTKSQYAKGSLHQRANLARNHGQAYSQSAGPLKTYSRKIPAVKITQDIVKKSESTSKDAEMKNIVQSTDSSIKLTNDGSKKKMILRKKPQKSTDEIRDLKNCNISNSDSERDSTITTLTNISADSLENIPCKMATRRDKSKSQELIYNGTNGNMEEGIDSQGTKLCQIKATRKKSVGFSNNLLNKEGKRTVPGPYTTMSVCFSNPTLAKKK